jgi:hypothetical protein
MLDDAYDQDMPAEDTSIHCFAFDRKENMRGICRIRIAQHNLFERFKFTATATPHLFVFLQFSTDASMHSSNFHTYHVFICGQMTQLRLLWGAA